MIDESLGAVSSGGGKMCFCGFWRNGVEVGAEKVAKVKSVWNGFGDGDGSEKYC